MEERIIDEEYGRGIRLKKTKDGYVDATDELAEEEREVSEAETGAEESEGEVVFEFPDLDEDDEELATLTPEEAAELKKQREEMNKRRQAEYEGFVERGTKRLNEGNFEKAAVEFAAGMLLVPDHKEAAVGLWRARTQNFSNPDAIVEEYAEQGDEAFDEFRYEVGEDAVEEIAKTYRVEIEKRLAELAEEKAPIENAVLEKQESRREFLSERLKRDNIFFFATLIPTLLCLIAGIVFAGKINTRPDKVFLWVTIASFAVCAVFAVVFLVAWKKRIDTVWIIKKNEDLTSTEDGAKFVDIRLKEEFYQKLLG